jgi:hypothetical protein
VCVCVVSLSLSLSLSLSPFNDWLIFVVFLQLYESWDHWRENYMPKLRELNLPTYIERVWRERERHTHTQHFVSNVDPSITCTPISLIMRNSVLHVPSSLWQETRTTNPFQRGTY